MKTKKLLMVLFVLTTALFYSCGSDDSSNNNGNNDDNPATDDNTPGETSALIGTWEANKLFYAVGGQEIPWNFTDPVYRPCEIADYLTISAAAVAKLTETHKNAENECVEGTKTGSWTETTITIPGETTARTVVSVNETKLVLKYPDNSSHNLGEIKVEYSRQ